VHSNSARGLGLGRARVAPAVGRSKAPPRQVPPARHVRLYVGWTLELALGGAECRPAHWIRGGQTASGTEKMVLFFLFFSEMGGAAVPSAFRLEGA
jgi:hypothetical protein